MAAPMSIFGQNPISRTQQLVRKVYIIGQIPSQGLQMDLLRIFSFLEIGFCPNINMGVAIF